MRLALIAAALATASLSARAADLTAAQHCTRALSGMVDQTGISPKGLRGKTRDVASLVAVVLHQMGFRRGNEPKKYDDVKAHFVVLPNGTIVQNHPIESWIPSSNKLNALGVSIEFSGNFSSVRKKWDHSNTKEEHHPAPEQIASARCLLIHLKSKMPSLRHVLGHVQGASNRQNCPGPEIWCGVAEWSMKNLGLADGGPGFKVDPGIAIDAKWRTWCTL
jgi:hypothetical protein